MSDIKTDDALRGEVAFLEAEHARLKTQLDKAHADAVDARTAIALAARKLIPGFRFDGKTNPQIVREVIGALHPDLRTDGLSDDFMAGYFKLSARS